MGAVRLGRRLADPGRCWSSSSSRSGSSRSPSTAGSPRTGPDPAHLTEFYLILSAGGALASAFVALIAPQVFPDVWEYPILLVGALVALAAGRPGRTVVRRTGTRFGLDFSPFVRGFRGGSVPYLVGAGLLTAVLVVTGSPVTETAIRWLLVGGLILTVGARPWFLAIATAFVLVLATFVLQPPVEFRARSFFGVTEVLRPADGKVAILMNGTTVHGTQYDGPGAPPDPGHLLRDDRSGRRHLRARARTAGRDRQARRGRRARGRDARVLHRRPD